MSKPVPDRAIVAQLQRVDPDLSVEWDDVTERWAVMHALQVPGNLEETADLMARELQARMREEGYVRDFHDCQSAAWDQLRTCKLVCYVADDDGAYRPLDGRIVEKLQRMRWNLENLGLRGMQDMLRVKADALRQQRERASDDIWESIRRDPVFARVLSDVLWGTQTRSVIVPEGIDACVSQSQ